MALVICPLDSLMDNHSKDLIQKGISSAILRCGGLETDTAERDSCSDTESSSSDDEKLLAIDSETENCEQCEKPIINKNRIKTIKPITARDNSACTRVICRELLTRRALGTRLIFISCENEGLVKKIGINSEYCIG